MIPAAAGAGAAAGSNLDEASSSRINSLETELKHHRGMEEYLQNKLDVLEQSQRLLFLYFFNQFILFIIYIL